MSDPLNEALGIGSPAGTSTAHDAMMEIEFPDGAISRYPAAVARNLVAQGRVLAKWRARTPGKEDWLTVEELLEGPPSTNDINTPAPSSAASSVRQSMGTTSQSEDGPVLASIGQKSMIGLLKGEGLASTWLVLTPSRIYGNGRTLTSGTSSRTRIVADISKLSSISMEYRSRWILLVIGFLLMGVTFLLLLSVQNQFLSYFLAPLFLIGSFMVVVYFLTRRRFLVLNLSGYACIFSMSGVPEDEVLAFVERVITVLGQRVSPD